MGRFLGGSISTLPSGKDGITMWPSQGIYLMLHPHGGGRGHTTYCLHCSKYRTVIMDPGSLP